MVESASGWLWSSHRERCEMAGTGSVGACPTNGLLAPLPIDLPQPWTAYVDTPVTGTELAKIKRKLR